MEGHPSLYVSQFFLQIHESPRKTKHPDIISFPPSNS